MLGLLGLVLWLTWGGNPGGMAGPPAASGPEGASVAVTEEPPVGSAEVAAAPQRTPTAGAGLERAWLRLRDRITDRPVAGARLHRFRDEAELGVTTADGTVALPPDPHVQVAAIADGYLLRLIGVPPGTTRDSPLQVAMEPDRVTLRCRLRFLRPDGELAESVRVRFRPLQPDTDGLGVVGRLRGDDPALRAWLEHGTVAAMHSFAGLHFQLGSLNAARVHHLAGEDEVRFSSGGRFRLEATAGELVASQTFAAERAAAEGLVVPLQPGRYVAGMVVAASSDAAVAGATVAPTDGGPVDAVTTDAAGGFRLGPFAEAVVVLELRHVDMEPLRHGPVRTGGEPVTIVMTCLPTTVVRGEVRSRADGRPLAAAVVSAAAALGSATSAETDAAGRFALRLPAGELVTLTVHAERHLPWREVVTPDGPHLDVVLWPAAPEERLRARLSGGVAGTVQDAAGTPVGGIPVQFIPLQPAPPSGLAGRRVLAGAVPDLPSTVTSAADGTFRIETLHPGPAIVMPVDGVTASEDGVHIEVTLGHTRSGVRLVQRRRDDR